MTIQEIRSQVDNKLLMQRSVYAVIENEHNPLRIVRVGTKVITILRNSGEIVSVLPERVQSIQM